MTSDNGRQERLVARSGIPAEVAAMLERRAEAFANATNRKGAPMTYGAGKEPTAKTRQRR